MIEVSRFFLAERDLKRAAKCTALFSVSCLTLTACDRHDAELSKQLAGTWTRGGSSSEMTFDSNGSFHSRWISASTNNPKEWIYSGTWTVKKDLLATTVTNSSARNSTNVESIGSVDDFKIIGVDDNQLTLGDRIQTNTFERKK